MKIVKAEISKTVEVGDLVESKSTGNKYLIIEDSSKYKALSVDDCRIEPFVYDSVEELISFYFSSDVIVYKSNNITLAIS